MLYVPTLCMASTKNLLQFNTFILQKYIKNLNKTSKIFKLHEILFKKNTGRKNTLFSARFMRNIIQKLNKTMNGNVKDLYKKANKTKIFVFFT